MIISRSPSRQARRRGDEVDLILLVQGAAEFESGSPSQPDRVLSVVEVLVLPVERCRAYRWPRASSDPTVLPPYPAGRTCQLAERADNLDAAQRQKSAPGQWQERAFLWLIAM